MRSVFLSCSLTHSFTLSPRPPRPPPVPLAAVEGLPLTSVIAGPSVVVRARADYSPETTHRFAFIINTAGKRLDVVAPSEAILRLWVEGVRCLAAYRDSLLVAVQSRYSRDVDGANDGVDRMRAEVQAATIAREDQ